MKFQSDKLQKQKRGKPLQFSPFCIRFIALQYLANFNFWLYVSEFWYLSNDFNDAIL